ncbi:hypothetical protein PIB30_056453 [Stylosanthes scabra]|uniref:Uncharacterized protein n=1 Tax=Stylosanthes scabra TaxID=79078 RepID=A0ABU6WJ06_9FABA|nr:hypothetical protein [Stylosanthes scabra]
MLNARACDCDEFQEFHYLCCQAIATCASGGLEWGAYVDPIFTVTNLFKVYEMKFLPIPDENLCPEWMGSRAVMAKTMGMWDYSSENWFGPAGSTGSTVTRP